SQPSPTPLRPGGSPPPSTSCTDLSSGARKDQYEKSDVAPSEGAEDADELAGRAVREPGDGAVRVPHDPLAVDDEHAAAREADRPERAVGLGDRLVGVGEERELEPVLRREALVALQALRRDAEHLGVELVERVEAVVVVVELLGAHRRVV